MRKMRVIKRIKWPGWAVLVLFFTVTSGTIYYATSMKTEAYVEGSNSLKQTASVQGEEKEEKQEPVPDNTENEENQPEANESPEQQEQGGQEQEQPGEETESNPNGKYVALTFDDGPHPNVTPEVLQTLKEHDIKATFFMLGSQVEKYPETAAQVAREGHEIGNHTYHHPNLRKQTYAEMMEEVRKTNEKIELATGVTPELFRPPYGIYTNEVLDYAGTSGYSMVLWSVDSLDWKHRNAEAIHRIVTQQIVNESIVLLHDIHATTAEALPALIQSLQKEGYSFLTVSELLAIQGATNAGPHF